MASGAFTSSIMTSISYYAFDLLHIGGWDISNLELIKRKELLEPLVANKPGLQFNGHEAGDGELILKHAGKLGLEGVVSKTGNRGLWRKAKALNRQEFVVVGWSDPEGSRPHLGALLGYYTDDGKGAAPERDARPGAGMMRMAKLRCLQLANCRGL
jgi:ATP-dependent DNA ligase